MDQPQANRSALQKETRVRNREFIAAIRNQTVCANCGGQPIEWHHEDHPLHPGHRVSCLGANCATFERIQREIDRCTPLCRRCHMQADGRLQKFVANTPHHILPPQYCTNCQREYKPLRRGYCSRCYEHIVRGRVPTGKIGRPKGAKDKKKRAPYGSKKRSESDAAA